MKTYEDLLQHVMTWGERHEDRTGVGTLSTFGLQYRHNFIDGFPLITTKKVSLRWIFEELKWFLSGSTNNNDLLKSGVTIWNEWSKPDGSLGPVYGKQFRDFGGVDQIQNLLDDLELSPNSRRIIVSAWNPPELPQMALAPCHCLWQVKVHGDQMSLHLYQRSADIFLGVPYNIASYGLLLCILCKMFDKTPRDLIISFGDLHLYSNHLEQAKLQLSRKPFNFPELEVSIPERDSKLQQLLDLRWEDIKLIGYKSHPKIDAPVAV